MRLPRFISRSRKKANEEAQDGKPYILSLVIGPAEENPRSKGFTFVSKTEFANLDDMRFYDEQCPAHKVLKGLAGEFGVGPDDVLSVHYTPSHIALL